MAYTDLGGLGSKQGAAVFYNWAAPSLIPQVLPWLAILVLLLLKPNRCASAWWIGIPLACVGGLACVPQSVLELLPSSQFEMLLDLISGLGFGLAAVWLLSSYLGWKHRMLAFLGILLVQGGFSLLVFGVGQAWGEAGIETLQVAIALAVSAFVMSVALSLAGLACRRRYGWLRLTLWLITALVVIWLLVLGPIFMISMIASGGNVPLLALVAIVGVATGITFGVLLPFLVVSFANGFYRERLKGLLHLGGVTPPPVINPLAPTLAEVAAGIGVGGK